MNERHSRSVCGEGRPAESYIDAGGRMRDAAEVGVVGVDFGATTIKVGLVQRGRIVQRAKAPTRAELGVDALIEEIAALVARVRRGRLSGVGVGFCGMIDAGDGRVMESTDTLPGWVDVPLGARLSERTRLPTVVDNDANCSALGEATCGAGVGASPFVIITLGTGVGGGIVIDGRLVRGAGYMAAHLGHIKVRAGGRKCACGARGCVEAYASAYAFRRAYGADADVLFRDARAGVNRAVRLVAEAGGALGSALADITNTLNPDRIAIGGGIGKSWRLLAPYALEAFRAKALRGGAASTKIVRAKLGDDAGILGAAALL